MASYLNIIKTTGLIGGIQVFTILFALVKNKVVALLLGREGIGAFGLYTGFTDMLSNISGLGMNQSASRQIAKANAENDSERISKSVYVLRRAVLLTSLVGAAFMCFKARAISVSLFDTEDKIWAVMLVSSVIIFNGISQGQQALLNGLRQIKALAMCRIIGAICSAIFTIVVVYLFSEKGIPLSLVSVALCNFGSSWWYVRKMKIKTICPNKKETLEELKGLLGIGISFAVAGMVASTMGIISRIYISDNFGLATLGEYMASWSISNLYIGIILGAMGIDFMPRLSALLNDKEKTNQVINEQIELGVLAAGFGVLGILVFSPVVLVLLYSNSFSLAPDIIRWQILGVGLRVLAWPFGYVLTSHGMGVRYVSIQSFFFVGEYLLLVIFTRLFGPQGLGMNYFVGYSIYVIVAWSACYMATGFKASPLMLKILGVSLLFQLSAFLLSFFSSSYICYGLGTVLILGYVYWVLHIMRNNMQIDLISKLRKKLGKG